MVDPYAEIPADFESEEALLRTAKSTGVEFPDGSDDPSGTRRVW